MPTKSQKYEQTNSLRLAVIEPAPLGIKSRTPMSEFYAQFIFFNFFCFCFQYTYTFIRFLHAVSLNNTLM